MFQRTLTISIGLVLASAFVAAATSPAKLSAAEIADKNIAARGGVQAWRAVQTLSFTGKMGAGGNQRAALPQANPGTKGAKLVLAPRSAEEVQLPFAMELKRPRKSRLELQFNGQTAVQVYDGVNGWKVRPFLNRSDVEAFTPDELRIASTQPDLDGLLVDYAAKGTKLEVAAIEKVEDRNTYKLKLALKDGQTMHVWIDAETFLEAKIEGQPRRLDGVSRPVEVYYRDYRNVDGLKIPFVLETRVLPVAPVARTVANPPIPAEKIVIDKVMVNPNLEESLFKKPNPGSGPKSK